MLLHDVDGGGELDLGELVGEDAEGLEVVGDDHAETSRSLRPCIAPHVTDGVSYSGNLEDWF